MVIGRPNDVYRPEAFFTYKGKDYPVSSIGVSLVAGQIATASMEIPPEVIRKFFADQDDNPVDVYVGEAGGEREKIFSGYAAGPSSTVSGESVNFGYSLIHAARNLDDGRLWAPEIHPMSLEDYSTYVALSSTTSLQQGPESLGLRFDITQSIVGECVRVMKGALEAVSAVTPAGIRGLEGISQDSAARSEAASAALAIINTVGSCVIGVGAGDTARPLLEAAAARRVEKILWGSISSAKSAWDVLAMLLATFGITLICKRDGKVDAMAFFEGVRPPSENALDAVVIGQLNAKSKITRPVSSAMLISYGLPMSSGGKGYAGSASLDEIRANGALVAHYSSGKRGGIVVGGLPEWMIPTGIAPAMPEIPADMALALAKDYYYSVANSGRSMAVVVPLMPSAHPGTTCFFRPISDLNAFSGKTLPTDSTYAGFIYKVDHAISASGGPPRTTLYMKNIFTADEFDDMPDSPALFPGDKPPLIA